jgi:putative ABC transport system permease protein
MAIGAKAATIARGMVLHLFALVLAGSSIGILLGFVSARFIESLLFEVKTTDIGVLALPTITILAVALLAALPAIMRAVRIDPAKMLRLE